MDVDGCTDDRCTSSELTEQQTQPLTDIRKIHGYVESKKTPRNVVYRAVGNKEGDSEVNSGVTTLGPRASDESPIPDGGGGRIGTGRPSDASAGRWDRKGNLPVAKFNLGRK